MPSLGLRQLNGHYSAREFGLGRAGLAAHTAINRAITQANADGGGVVELPADAGTVILDGSIEMRSNVELAIPYGVTLQLNTGLERALIVTQDPVAGISNIRITGGGTINGNRTNQDGIAATDLVPLGLGGPAVHGVYLDNVSNGLIEGIRITSCRQDGLHLDNCTRVEVRNVVATDCGRDGVRLTNSTYCPLVNMRSYINAQRETASVQDAIPVFSARAYGAVGDGAINEQPALQRALNAANTAGGGVVQLDPGTYMIDSAITIYSRTRLIGAGIGRTIVRFRNQTGTAGTLDGPTRMVVVNTSAVDTEIAHLTIDGQKDVLTTGSLSGIAGTSPTRLHVHDVRIVDVDGIAVRMDTSPVDCVIERVVIENCDGIRAIYVTDNVRISNCVLRSAGTAYSIAVANHCIIEHCRMVGGATQRYGILFNGSTCTVDGCDIDYSLSGGASATDCMLITRYNSNDCRIIANNLVGGALMGGVFIGGSGSVENIVTASRNVVQGNTIAGCVGDSILVGSGTEGVGNSTGVDNVVSGNVVTGAVRNGAVAGLGIEIRLDRTSIVGNVVTGCADTAIWLDHSDQIVADNVLVGNQLAATGSVGAIRIGGDSRFVITGNVIVNNGLAGATAVAGIAIHADTAHVRDVIIANNLITDTRAGGSKTQTHGVISNNAGAFTVGELYILNNYLRGNATAAIALNGTGGGDVVRDNIGWTTEISGTATIASGSTSTAVVHGLSATPALDDIQVTATNNLGNATKVWISAPTSTQFTLNVDADPGVATATVVWQVKVR